MSIKVFCEMFKNTALVPLIEEYSKYSVILNEPQVTDSEVKISGVPRRGVYWL